MSPRWLVTALLSAAILSPLVRPAGWDSYPISSFPMFARGDLGTRVRVGHALSVDPAGRRRPMPLAAIGTPEPMVAKRLVELAIAEGRATELCARIASRAPEDSVRVEIVTSVYDSTRYFSDPTPVSREVHAACDVSR